MIKNLKEFKYILEFKIKRSKRVFIVPHTNIDFDAIGAAIGMVEICKHLGVEATLIVDDNIVTMDVGVRSIYEFALDKYSILKSSEVPKYRTGNDLLVTVDVNKTNLIPLDLKEQLSSFSSILILDHHKEDEFTIPTEDDFIDINTSSTCEMVTRLFRLFGINIDQSLAKCFLAGIFLDTNKLRKNATQGTLEVTAKLISKGVTIQDVNDLFVEDFENDRKVQHLIDGTTFIPYTIHNVAIISNKENPETIYTPAELAQAADYLLQYKVDAAYAIGFLSENQVGISARTLGGMDIAAIMHVFNGGGNEHSAAARIFGRTDLRLVINELLKLICKDDYYTVKSSVLENQLQNHKSDTQESTAFEKKKIKN